MKQLDFTCPDCGNSDLEEVMVSAVVSSLVDSFDEDGNVEYLAHLDEIYDGVIDRFQCRVCGYIIETVDNYEDLYKVASKNGWLEK